MSPNPLRGRDFRLVVASVALSAIGDFVAVIVLMARVHDITGSGFAISALVAANWTPIVLFSPVAGVFADRFETVRVLGVVSLAQAGVALALAFNSSLAPILVLSFLLGTGVAVAQPSEFALIPAIAGKDRLNEANGHVETARYVGFTVGPLLGGALAASGSYRLALIVNSVSFLAVAIAAALLRVRRPPAPADGDGSSAGGAREGFSHLLGEPMLRLVVLVATIVLLVMSISATADVFFAKDVLHAGNFGFGALFAVWTLGMVLGALRLSRRVGAGLAAAALVAMVVQGSGIAAAAGAAVLWVALIGYFVGGAAHGLKNVLMRTLIQRQVPDRLHGRVFAAYNGLRNGAELAALAAGGILVETIGARYSELVAGVGPVLAGLAGLALYKRARAARGAPPKVVGGC